MDKDDFIDRTLKATDELVTALNQAGVKCTGAVLLGMLALVVTHRVESQDDLKQLVASVEMLGKLRLAKMKQQEEEATFTS